MLSGCHCTAYPQACTSLLVSPNGSVRSNALPSLRSTLSPFHHSFPQPRVAYIVMPSFHLISLERTCADTATSFMCGYHQHVMTCAVAAADSTEAAEGWVDAFLMVAHIATAHQLPALAHALTVEFPP